MTPHWTQDTCHDGVYKAPPPAPLSSPCHHHCHLDHHFSDIIVIIDVIGASYIIVSHCEEL